MYDAGVQLGLGGKEFSNAKWRENFQMSGQMSNADQRTVQDKSVHVLVPLKMQVTTALCDTNCCKTSTLHTRNTVILGIIVVY